MSLIKKLLFFIILTPVFFLSSHYLAVFPHEYGHALVASWFGFKDHFWDITYGGGSWRNILFLSHVSDSVDYHSMYVANMNWLVALTAFAGPGIGNGLTYVISRYLLSRESVQKNVALYYFIFWWNIHSIGNFIDYVPSRTFSIHGDMGSITDALGISPWWLMVVFGYAVILIVVHFYQNILPSAFEHLKLEHKASKALLMFLVTCVLFCLYGTTGLTGYGFVSHIMSLLCAWAVVPIIYFTGRSIILGRL